MNAVTKYITISASPVPCQTSNPAQPGYCSGMCSNNGSNACVAISTPICPSGMAWDSTKVLCTGNPISGTCQTSNSSKPSYCSGTCVNGVGVCQTTSSAQSGYCAPVASTCANNMGSCQTSNPAQPGYCSGMCSNGSGTYQTSDFSRPGYCAPGGTATCSINNSCPASENWNSSYNSCTAQPTCPTNMTFDSSSNQCIGGQISLNLSQISLGSISNAVNAIA